MGTANRHVSASCCCRRKLFRRNRLACRRSFHGQCKSNITLIRTFHLLEGESISGSAFFYNGDTNGQDSAWVKILDEEGRAIAQPWFDISGNSHTCATNSTSYLTASTWTSWSWQAPIESNFSLILGVTTGGDNNMASYGFFDDIRVHIVPVPEPSWLTLVTIGAVGLAAFRRKKNPT